MRICCIFNCNEKHYGRGFCAFHYREWYNDNYRKNHPKISRHPLWDRIIKNDNGCWLWQGCRSKKKNSYGQITYKKRGYATHRLAWELTFGCIPEDLFVLHKCDVPLCINPDHLFLGTLKDNSKDMMNKNRGKNQFKKGQHRCWNLKFTEEIIKEIKMKYQNGNKQIDLAKEYNTSQGYISNIVTGLVWKEIK